MSETDPTTNQAGGPPPTTGKYRAKLDAALADAARWREALVQRVAEQHQLSPDDLEEYDVDEIDGRAILLRQQRDKQRERELTEALAAKGIEGDERQTALDRLLGKEPIPTPRAETPQDRHASLRSISAPPANTSMRGKDEGGHGAERARRVMTRQVAEGRFRQTTERKG